MSALPGLADLAPIRRLAACCSPRGHAADARDWPLETWHELESLARQHALSGLLINRMSQRGATSMMPAAILQPLTAAGRSVAVSNLRRFAALKSICRSFASLDIPVVLLKGAHLATGVYPDMSMRQMLDIDLLVRSSDISRAIDACRALGFETDRPPTTAGDPEARHARPMRNAGAGSVELHWTIARAEHAPGLEIDRLWERSIPSRFESSARVLAPPDLLLHVATHAAYDHQLNQGLRPLFDLAEIAALWGDDAFWTTVIEGAQRWGVARGVGASLWASRTLVDAAIPQSVADALVPDLSPDLQGLIISQACAAPALRNPRLPVSGLIANKGAARWRYGLRRLLPPMTQASREFGMPRTSLAFQRHYLLEVARRLLRHGPAMLRWQLSGNTSLEDFAANQRRFNDWLLPGATGRS